MALLLVLGLVGSACGAGENTGRASLLGWIDGCGSGSRQSPSIQRGVASMRESPPRSRAWLGQQRHDDGVAVGIARENPVVQSLWLQCTGCVEVAVRPGAVAVRDTKDRALAPHRYASSDWAAFVAGVREGEFDRP